MKTNHCLVPLCNICGEMIRSASKFKDVLRSPDPQMLMIRREYSENDIIPDKDVNTLLGKVESELTLPSTELKVLKYKNKKKLKKNRQRTQQRKYSTLVLLTSKKLLTRVGMHIGL